MRRYLKIISINFIKSIAANVPFLFINAWNEWAEGTYLEPDKKNGYGYLNAVKDIVEKYKKINR
uniref:glycoside hydrolase family 99-like domain-containing protein n=1 Tax=Enterobacter cloacae complex sp. 280C5 TaxID=3395861 RepID=UPI003CE670B4